MAESSVTQSLAASLAQIGAELDAFLRCEHGDAATRYAMWSETLAGPLPQEGIGAEGVLDELAQMVIPNGGPFAEPGFWGWVTVAPELVPTIAALAGMVAAPQRYLITAFNYLEELSLDWLVELCGLPAAMKGVYSSGGSVANLVALGAARQWAMEQAGIDPSASGLGAARLALYASTEAHHTVQRSAGVLGIGRANVRVVATDDRQRLDTVALRRAVEQDVASGVLPVAVVAVAGTTNTGAIDPLREAGAIAKEYGAWFHVDGAYGLPGILDERLETFYDGLELADSVIVDPHKWLGAPVGVAATFVRDRSVLHRAFTQEPASYLEGAFSDPSDVQVSVDSIGIPYADFAVELSAPSRGVIVWSFLRELGREGVRQRICRDNDLARHLADRVRTARHVELLAEPVLSICCFRYAADGIDDLDALNANLVRRLVRETRYMPSSTVVNGRFAIRPCFINSRTEVEHVDGLLDAVIEIGDDLRKRA